MPHRLPSLTPRAWRRRWFGIDPGEVGVARRGFHVPDPHVAARLEEIGRTFLHGYHAALDECLPEPLAVRLRSVDPEARGWAFEGAGMALCLRDQLTPWGRWRLDRFIATEAEPYIYLALVGAGWAHARLGSDPARTLARLDPVLGCLLYDGCGFHDGYFHPRRAQGATRGPGRPRNRPRAAPLAAIYDQGVGRSLWFVEGADPVAVARCIASTDPERHGDLWSGVGLAAGYAGGLGPEGMARLRIEAGPWLAAVAQGVCFAAKARVRADHSTQQTETACAIICRRDATSCAALTDAVLAEVRCSGALAAAPGVAYQAWRAGVARACPGSGVAP